jgi:hypothetical protein
MKLKFLTGMGGHDANGVPYNRTPGRSYEIADKAEAVRLFRAGYVEAENDKDEKELLKGVADLMAKEVADRIAADKAAEKAAAEKDKGESK